MLKKTLILWAFLPVMLFAALSMPPMFSDHAVLARSEKTPVWGKATAGEEVQVSIAGITKSAVADADGRWRIDFDLSSAEDGPFEMVVQCGEKKVILEDILIGEVWLCSGQSNMGFKLKTEEHAKEHIASSANQKLRLFSIRLRASIKREEKITGEWKIAAPDTVGDFSAVGYLFGKGLQDEIKCPVGLIDNAWGGSAVEAWVTRDFMRENTDLAKWCDETYDNFVNYEDLIKQYISDYQSWLKECALEEPTETLPPEDAKWRDNQNLKTWNAFGPSVVWLRKKITIPEDFSREGGILELYQHGTNAVFYIDGQEIARNTLQDELRGGNVRSRKFEPGELPVGEHEFAIRYWCTYDGFTAARVYHPLPDGTPISQGFQMAVRPIALTSEQIATRPKRPGFRADANKVPELLYNALIWPLKPYRISGTIWYQGCTNGGRPWQYPCAIQGLIREWRRDFECEFPFYYCQLANNGAKSPDPKASGWGEIREGQEGALAMPKTAQAVLIDCGEAGDIHPIDKVTPAKRLLAIALANTYGRNIPWRSPTFKSKTIEDGKIRVEFEGTEGGLTVKPLSDTYPVSKTKRQFEPLVRNSPASEVEGFALAGADGKWHWANARIEGDTVLVWSDEVPEPVNVRYAYQYNPTCNLYNKAGFPAAGFSK